MFDLKNFDSKTKKKKQILKCIKCLCPAQKQEISDLDISFPMFEHYLPVVWAFKSFEL